MQENNQKIVASLKTHFTPTFEMLEKVIEICPEDIWAGQTGCPIWQQIFHTVTGIEFWFRKPGESFQLPAMGKQVSPELGEKTPDWLTKEELVQYVQKMQEKADQYFAELDDTKLFASAGAYDKLTNMDVILMQIRHFQHHIGYCNSVLAHNEVKPVDWIDIISE